MPQATRSRRRATGATPDEPPQHDDQPTRRVTIPDAPTRVLRRVSLRAAIAAVRKYHGMVAVAARQLGCNRATLYRMADRHPELADAIDEARQVQIDAAELGLFAQVQDGEPWALQFVLRTIGKTRGYVERSEVDDLRQPDLSQLSDDELRAWLSKH
jgi:hypothetical protein